MLKSVYLSESLIGSTFYFFIFKTFFFSFSNSLFKSFFSSFQRANNKVLKRKENKSALFWKITKGDTICVKLQNENKCCFCSINQDVKPFGTQAAKNQKLIPKFVVEKKKKRQFSTVFRFFWKVLVAFAFKKQQMKIDCLHFGCWRKQKLWRVCSKFSMKKEKEKQFLCSPENFFFSRNVQKRAILLKLSPLLT